MTNHVGSHVVKWNQHLIYWLTLKLLDVLRLHLLLKLLNSLVSIGIQWRSKGSN